jgi:hypothetical protein
MLIEETFISHIVTIVTYDFALLINMCVVQCVFVVMFCCVDGF